MSSSLVYLLTCSRGIRDGATGFFSFIDVFDAIFIPKGQEFIWLSFCVGGRLYCDIVGNIKIDVTYIYPDGKTVSPPIPVTGIVSKGDVHFSANMPITKFDSIGKYILKISLNGEEIKAVSEFYFNVKKQE